mmetsp:Transcript_24149/g.47488  ORF Transcript_24149/g.47488 Transcript_24149/m.47488 type:complete len:367 (+) Transcript_24149:68-1168(+)
MWILLTAILSIATASPVYDGQLRDEGDGLTVAYMVPGGADNHAVSLEQLPDGTLVAAWFAGLHEQASGLAIVSSRLPAGSQAWTNTTVVSERDGYANQNPLLFYDNTTGILHLWHTQAKPNSGESEAEIYHLSSTDGGVGWTGSTRYFDQKGVFTRNRIIRRRDQTLLWPFYSTASEANGKDPMFAWTSSKTVPDSGFGWKSHIMDQGGERLEQPTCWYQPHDKSKVECYFRDCNQKHIYRAESTDDGKSFTKPIQTDLKNPGSAIEGFPLSNGDLVLIFNPTTDDVRDPLSAGISKDDGKTWVHKDVQNGPSGANSTEKGEFAYPTVLQTPDGNIHAMYTYGPSGVGQAKTIKYVRFTEKWVTSS